MPIEVRLDLMLARRKVKSKDLAAYAGITEANLSLLKHGKVKGVRFETLARVCAYLDCQPGDLLAFVPESAEDRKDWADGQPLDGETAEEREMEAKRACDS